MEELIEKEAGWKPIPLPLKILFVVLVLWTIGSVLNLSNLSENGLPLAGVFVFGTTAMFVVLLLDIIGLFILNSVVAFFTVRDELGTPQILAPLLVSSIFIAVIYWQRGYFRV